MKPYVEYVWSLESGEECTELGFDSFASGTSTRSREAIAAIAAPICRRVRTLERDVADLISPVSAAVRARDRSHVSRQCERRGKNRPNFEEIRERSGDRLSGLALKDARARELWPDIEDVALEHRGKI